MSQVLAHMWLDLKMKSGSDFEKKLGEFFQHQIEESYYGLEDGTENPVLKVYDVQKLHYEGRFKLSRNAVLKHGLRKTLDHIRTTGNFPPVD
ncbi:hypothetical protein CerSpe_207830 [Prunus speciosa]